MESRRLYDQLISDPEDIRQLFESSPELQKHMEFSFQLDFGGTNHWNLEIVYDSLLLFLTHLPSNYFGLNQSYKECKNKLMFCLPKKAFRKYVNKTLKSYRNSDIRKKLKVLGENKVVTKAGVVVNLFTVIEEESFEDFWCLLIHQTTIPYLCSMTVLPILVLERMIPYFPTQLLSLKEMRDERKKAGLYIPPFMNIVDSEDLPA